MSHGNTSPPGMQVYENVDPLSWSSVKTTQLYENIPTVSLPHHQNNIEMNQRTAYGVLKETHQHESHKSELCLNFLTSAISIYYQTL